MVGNIDEVCRRLSENDWYCHSFQMYDKQRFQGQIYEFNDGMGDMWMNVPVVEKKCWGLLRKTEIKPLRASIWRRVEPQIASTFDIEYLDGNMNGFKWGDVYLMLDPQNPSLKSCGKGHSDGGGRPNTHCFVANGEYGDLVAVADNVRTDPRYLSRFAELVFGWKNERRERDPHGPAQWRYQPDFFTHMEHLNLWTPEKGIEKIDVK